MITQYEVYSLLTREIPVQAEKNYPSRPNLQMYAVINYFSDYTRDVVKNHHLSLAKQCFAIAEDLYIHGEPVVRLLIENSFIYNFSSFMPESKEQRRLVKSIIPFTLYAIYIKQVLQTRNSKTVLF